MGAGTGRATRAHLQLAAAMVLVVVGVVMRMLTVSYDAQTTAHVTDVIRSADTASGSGWGAGTSFAPIPACQVRVDFTAAGRHEQATVSDHPTLCGRHEGDPVTVYYASDNPIQVGLAPSSGFGAFPIVVGLTWLVVLGVRRRLPGSPGLERRRTS
ncbi:hypothetical protein [Nocardioides conyzicola]|uniref:DUF3592 domain-containing protein n=1 Tax=Nocardioides conyzicola TaxID=1651781 RepID=A0ABP8XV50_9ACTN